MKSLQAFDTFLERQRPPLRAGAGCSARFPVRARKQTKSAPRRSFHWAEARSIGFLAIGSVDAERFHPGMSIDFLTRLGELVTEALKRF